MKLEHHYPYIVEDCLHGILRALIFLNVVVFGILGAIRVIEFYRPF